MAWSRPRSPPQRQKVRFRFSLDTFFTEAGMLPPSL